MKEISPSTLSKRGQYTFNEYDFLAHYLSKSRNNTYHPVANPEGVINFGTAVDTLMEKEMQERLTTGGILDFRSLDHQHYYDFRGKPHVRVAIAKFLTTYFNAHEDINPDHIIIMSGTASCLDSLAYSLFDPDDIYLTPIPTYGRIFTNFNDRSQAQPYPLDLPEEADSSGRKFALTSELLERKILELQKEGKRVKGFVLINPQNPLGDVYSPHLLRSLLEVCARYNIHTVMDEIYALSLLDPEAEVSSVLSIPDLPDPMRTHFVWSLTKDFGLAGARLGIIHTENPALLKVLKDLAFYCPAASIIQDMAAAILSDTKWLDDVFFPLRRKRLHEAYLSIKSRLEAMGIEVTPAHGGLFVWFDLKRYLRCETEEAEMELFYELFNAGVYIVPGTQLYCKSPGWFRMVFTASHTTMDLGLKRMKKVLKKRCKHLYNPLPSVIAYDNYSSQIKRL